MTSEKHLTKIAELINANVGQMPNEPDNLVVVNFRQGEPSLRSFGKKRSDADYPVLSINIRNVSYFNGFDIGNEITNILDGYSDEDFLSIKLLTNLNQIGRDLKDRYLFNLEFSCMIENKEEE